MNRNEKIDEMVKNYICKKNQIGESSVLEFHRKNLLIFLSRFLQFSSRFKTASSSLLSHEIFLVVEAATMVAKSDWEDSINKDTKNYRLFCKYFEDFNRLKSGIIPLDEGAIQCLDILDGNEESMIN
jgi:hypothetical protein